MSNEQDAGSLINTKPQSQAFACLTATNQTARMKLPEIRRARLERWFSDKTLPEREKSYLSQLIGGKASFGEKAARRLERDYGMGDGYLDRPLEDVPAGHVSPRRRTSEVKSSPKDEFTIPHLAVTGSMGPGTDLLEVEEVIERMTLKGKWLRENIGVSRIENLAIISGKGNSMCPTFNDGDLLLVDCGVRRVEVDGVYVLSAHGRLFIKTVRQRLDGAYEISSDNPSVKTVDILNGDHEVLVHGRVVWAWNGKKL